MPTLKNLVICLWECPRACMQPLLFPVTLWLCMAFHALASIVGISPEAGACDLRSSQLATNTLVGGQR